MKIKFVHCNQHGAVHELNEDGSCWCSCGEESEGTDFTFLVSQTMDEAIEECNKKELWFYHSEWT